MGKSFMYLAVICSLLFFLTGCNSDEEYNQLINQGQRAMEENNFSLAITFFQRARTLAPKAEEGQNALRKAINAQEKLIVFKNFLYNIKVPMTRLREAFTLWHDLQDQVQKGRIDLLGYKSAIKARIIPQIKLAQRELQQVPPAKEFNEARALLDKSLEESLQVFRAGILTQNLQEAQKLSLQKTEETYQNFFGELERFARANQINPEI